MYLKFWSANWWINILGGAPAAVAFTTPLRGTLKLEIGTYNW